MKEAIYEKLVSRSISDEKNNRKLSEKEQFNLQMESFYLLESNHINKEIYDIAKDITGELRKLQSNNRKDIHNDDIDENSVWYTKWNFSPERPYGHQFKKLNDYTKDIPIYIQFIENSTERPQALFENGRTDFRTGREHKQDNIIRKTKYGRFKNHTPQTIARKYGHSSYTYNNDVIYAWIYLQKAFISPETRFNTFLIEETISHELRHLHQQFIETEANLLLDANKYSVNQTITKFLNCFSKEVNTGKLRSYLYFSSLAEREARLQQLDTKLKNEQDKPDFKKAAKDALEELVHSAEHSRPNRLLLVHSVLSLPSAESITKLSVYRDTITSMRNEEDQRMILIIGYFYSTHNLIKYSDYKDVTTLETIRRYFSTEKFPEISGSEDIHEDSFLMDNFTSIYIVVFNAINRIFSEYEVALCRLIDSYIDGIFEIPSSSINEAASFILKRDFFKTDELFEVFRNYCDEFFLLAMI